MSLRLIPVLPSVGGESFAKQRSQFDFVFSELAGPTHAS